MAINQKEKKPKEKSFMNKAGHAVVGALKSGEKAWKDLDLRDQKNDNLRARIQGRDGRVL